MSEYHKIQTVFKRNPANLREVLEGQYALPEFEYLKDCRWVFTEKVDGTNTRVMWDGKSVVFGGKTDNAQMPVFLLYKLQELFEGTEKRQLFQSKFGDAAVCLYGEGYGAKIQKGGGNYIRDGVSFVLFDVRFDRWWLKREDVEDIANAFGIDVVPIIGSGAMAEAVSLARRGFNSHWGPFTAEGIVMRPEVELTDRAGHRIISKIKHRDFPHSEDTP